MRWERKTEKAPDYTIHKRKAQDGKYLSHQLNSIEWRVCVCVLDWVDSKGVYDSGVLWGVFSFLSCWDKKYIYIYIYGAGMRDLQYIKHLFSLSLVLILYCRIRFVSFLWMSYTIDIPILFCCWSWWDIVGYKTECEHVSVMFCLYNKG